VISLCVYDLVMKTWSQLIRDTFEATGRTMQSVSEESGVGYGRVHNFLKSGRGLKLDNAEKIAKALALELRPVKETKRKA
jgi:hypothetical protein